MGSCLDTSPGFCLVVVENAGRHCRPAKVVCEEIAGEQEFLFREEESTVPDGVPGQTNDFESVNRVTRIKPLVHDWFTVTEKNAARFFQPSTDSAPSTVVVPTFDMGLIEPGRENPAAGYFLKSCHIQGVIEMTVSEDEGAHIGEIPAILGEGFFDSGNAADESSIDEIYPIIREDEMMPDQDATELNDFSHKKKVPFFS